MIETKDAEIAHWRGWIGRTETRVQLADRESLRRFALACGWEGDVDSSPPPLSVWAWFNLAVPDAEIGADGHPRRGAFLPPISLPRRMFASARLEFPSPIRLDTEAEMNLRIADVALKRGRSGDLVFVEVERIVRQAGRICVSESQTLVYRDGGDAHPLPEMLAPTDTGEIWQPGAANLFRFSAATFNSHRIHYDRIYAREVEHYPDLVVQGPFAVSRLAALAARQGPLAALEFRALAPLFVDQPVTLCQLDETGFEARRCDGVPAIRMKVRHA
jgi:3-methylfumaryl-CoA hydratase